MQKNGSKINQFAHLKMSLKSTTLTKKYRRTEEKSMEDLSEKDILQKIEQQKARDKLFKMMKKFIVPL